MKVELIDSPNDDDVMLKIDGLVEPHRITFSRYQLHQVEWAIRKHLEGQPARNLKEGAGHE